MTGFKMRMETGSSHLQFWLAATWRDGVGGNRGRDLTQNGNTEFERLLCS